MMTDDGDDGDDGDDDDDGDGGDDDDGEGGGDDDDEDDDDGDDDDDDCNGDGDEDGGDDGDGMGTCDDGWMTMHMVCPSLLCHSAAKNFQKPCPAGATEACRSSCSRVSTPRVAAGHPAQECHENTLIMLAPSPTLRRSGHLAAFAQKSGQTNEASVVQRLPCHHHFQCKNDGAQTMSRNSRRLSKMPCSNLLQGVMSAEGARTIHL